MMNPNTVGAAADAATPDWRQVVAPYVGPDDWRASFQVVTTLGLLFATILAMQFAAEWSVFAMLALAPLASGLLVRTFILMHDCAHGSLFASRKVTEIVGFITGVLTMTPFGQWRRDHALHHASSGDLDRRGNGDVPTLTVREYLAKTPRQQSWYRFIRHPATLMLIGPLHLFFGQRIRGRSKATGDMQVNSVLWTNVAIVAFFAVAVWLGGWSMLLAYGVAWYFAGMAGVWLFYVQHQFEDAYWEEHGGWNYVEASIKGSSHLKLPALLRWFTGNIGVHHVHHLAPRIPNYRLQRCHDENAIFHAAPELTLVSGVAALRLALWDEDRRRLLRFDEVTGA